MAEEAKQETKKETVEYSNVSVVREPDGELSVWAGNTKLLGVVQPHYQNSHWGFAIPSAKVRLCERVPAQPVYADNVVPFIAAPSPNQPGPSAVA